MPLSPKAAAPHHGLSLSAKVTYGGATMLHTKGECASRQLDTFVKRPYTHQHYALSKWNSCKTLNKGRFFQDLPGIAN